MSKEKNTRRSFIVNFKKFLSENLVVILPLVMYSFLLFPFLYTSPCWDGSTELSTNTGTFRGGFLQSIYDYIKNLTNGGLHPPFKFIVSSIYYTIGGENILSYHLMGLTLGYLAILGIYFLCKKLFDKGVGIIASLLFATFPLFVANSLDNYTDFFVTVFLVLALFAYSQKRLIFYAILASFTTLSKDTGFILPLSILLLELYSFFLEKQKFFLKALRLSIVIIPIIMYFIWYSYVKFNGFEIFHKYILSETASKGAFVTIFYNLLTFNFFHQYAQAHILQLFYLNFTWVYWLIIIIGFTQTIKNFKHQKIKLSFEKNKQKVFLLLFLLSFLLAYTLATVTLQALIAPNPYVTYFNFNGVYWVMTLIIFIFFAAFLAKTQTISYQLRLAISQRNQKIKTIVAMIIFFVFYTISVLTFPVLSTPRYALPLIPIIVIAASFVIASNIKKIPVFFLLLLSTLNFVGLYFSVDPVSIALWGKNNVAQQSFYNISKTDIDDAVVYNLQYLLVMKKRSQTNYYPHGGTCNFTDSRQY
ncbi:MAG: glycosyltransferase family 39 protein [Candidatus Levybacteria bacterium]|nr:glycosyltransferase family 39 protein [Candidatus Levybacteria bacterium]